MKRPIRDSLIALSMVTTLSIAACGRGDRAVVILDDVDSISRSITGGLPPPSGASHYDAVVALLMKQGPFYSFFCSGTLISPDVVLTAGHCLADGRGNPKKLFVVFGDSLSGISVSDLHPTSATQTHPGYSSGLFSGIVNDIALIRLSTPVAVTPVPPLPVGKALSDGDAGLSVNFAGFGQTVEGSSGSGGSGTKLQVDGPVGGVSNPCSFSDGTTGNCIGDSASQVWYVQGDGQGGPCFGDSGGPMFVDRGTADLPELYVGGVTSYGDSTCSLYGVSTRPDAYGCWIADFVAPGSCSGGGGSCGDGVVDSGEDCDGGELGGASCTSLGYDGGTLACGAGCSFDTSGCTSSCSGLPDGAGCTADADCCSGRCKGRPGSKVCKE